MEKDLKFLNRTELIDVIYQLKKNEQALQAENAELKRQLKLRRITSDSAGSIAEAALSLSGVFTAAQDAADQYLAEIAQRRRDIETDYNTLIKRGQERAEAMLREAELRCAQLNAQAREAQQQLTRCEAQMDQIRREQLFESIQEQAEHENSQ